MSNSLDPDQARQIVGPDLGPICLQRLSADDTGRQRVKTIFTAIPPPSAESRGAVLCQGFIFYY